jgi:uncharacterized membrane protein
MLRFRALLEAAAAARAAGALDRAAALLREGLRLWRGEPFEGVTLSPADEPERVRLAEQHAAATEELLDIRLASGEHQTLVPELRGLVSAHPLRERLREQLMLALYRAGRQAEALAAYVETRDTLIEQLGVEPHARLRRLHQAILRDDPALAAPHAPAAYPAPMAPVPPVPPAAPAETAMVAVTAPYALPAVEVTAPPPVATGGRRRGRGGPALLRKRPWRWWHSLWMLPCILGVGIFSWISFLYIGTRARHQRWLRWAVWYGVAAVVAVVSGNIAPEWGKNGGAILALIVWIISIIHSTWVNREWLQWRAEHPHWYENSPPAQSPQ